MMALVLAVPPLFAQEPKAGPGVCVTLSDGTVLVSTGSDDVLKITTPYGEQKVPVSQIRLAKRLPTGSFVVQARGLAVTGELSTKDIELNTCIGPMRVASDDIRTISVPNGPRLLLDDATAAVWWFADSVDNTCRDLVKGRPFALQDYERAEEVAGAPAIVGKGPTALATQTGDADLDFGDQDYTMDIRFRMPKQIRGNVMLLQKGNPNTGQQEFTLCACNNGVVCAYSVRSGQAVQSQPNLIRREAWNTVTVVQRVQPPSCAIYVNGKPCASGQFSLPFASAAGLEWSIGSHARFGSGCEPPEAVQFVRFSRKARGSEEIEQAEKGWDSPYPVNAGLQGVLLRDGSFLRGEFPSLAQTTFRTRFGDLKLTEKAGSVRLFRMRLQDMEKERAGLQELIGKLGSAQAREREAATNRLISFGEIALPALRECELPTDAETRSRIADVLKKLEESGIAKKPVCDVLHLGGLSIQGWMELDPVVISTRRGKVQIAPSKVAELHFGRREPRPRPVLRLFSGESLEFDPAEGSTMPVETGFGRMSIPAEELKELAWDAEHKQWLLITERMTATGKISGSLKVETPLGPLALPLSEVKDLKPPAPPGSAAPLLLPPPEDR